MKPNKPNKDDDKHHKITFKDGKQSDDEEIKRVFEEMGFKVEKIHIIAMYDDMTAITQWREENNGNGQTVRGLFQILHKIRANRERVVKTPKNGKRIVVCMVQMR